MPPRTKRLTIAITGASGYIAGRLIGRLCADERVGSVIGFDVVKPKFSHDKFVFDVMDVRNPALEGRLTGVDVLLHLAFVMDPIKDEQEMRDVNVNGSQNVFRCAGRSGVRRVIYTSTAVVYGAHPDNDVPLTEESPLRANLDFSYPAHKLEVEFVIKEVAQEFPELRFTVFRPAIVFGPHVDNAWSRPLELPVLPVPKGYSPPLQFIHEDDVADALEFAVFHDLDGAYNLAAEGWLEAEEIAALVGKKRVELREPALFALAERMWALGLSDAPAGMIHYVMHPWVLSIEKLKAAGWSPKMSNQDALLATLERTKTRVRIGRSRVAKGDLFRGAVAVGAMGALAALGLARRSRARTA